MGKLYHLNVGFGDASIIISDTATFLIDCHGIEDFAYLLPQNKKIRGVFITHQHRDHFSGLRYLKENYYSIDYLICSPYDRRYRDSSVEYDEWTEFNSYVDYFKKYGSKVYTPCRQDNFDKPWWSPDGVDFWMLGPAYHLANSDTRELHDACLVIHAKIGDRKCLFTGDASDINLEYVADNTTNICNDILHASHHGSINGASLSFIKKCDAGYTVISTEQGVKENIPHAEALDRYKKNTKEQVYRTDLNGTLEWSFNV